MNEAIKELYKIINTETDETEVGWSKRRRMLDQWVREWTTEVSKSQAVIDSKYLTTEYKDFLVYKMATDSAEDIVEECLEIDKDRNLIETKLTFIRKKPKKKRF
jgi:hypothetical protein